MCRWINESINTSDIEVRLPEYIRDMISELYQADSDNLPAVYDQVSDDLDSYVKMLVPDVISKKEYNLIIQKFSYVGA